MANTANIQILRSYSNTVPSTLLDGQLAYSFVSNTLYIGSNTYGVLSVTDQQTANIARSAQANTVYTQGVDVTQNTNITYATSLAQSAFNAANNVTPQVQPAFNTANAAFLQANSAASNTVYTQGVDNTQNTNIGILTNNLGSNVLYFQGIENTQNTNITAVNTFAQSGYNQANTAATNSVYLQGGLNTANANIAYILGVDLTQNTNIGSVINNLSSNVNYFQGIENTQNTNITAVNTYATSAYNQANATNTYATSAYGQANATNSLAQSGYNQANATNTYASSAYNQANATNTYATSAYGQANSANNLAQSSFNQANASNSLAQSGYNQANASNSLAQSGYNQANATNNYATSAYGQANATNNYATSAYNTANSAQSNTVYTQGVDVTQNTNIGLLQGAMASANANIVSLFAIDLTQNASLLAVNTFANSSYNQANATNTYATSAYGQANATNTYATSAYGQANAANSLAQSGYNQANAANNLATSAYGQANATNNYATSAYNQANATNNYVTSAYGQANATNNYATSAYNQANATNTYATSAYSTANSAQANTVVIQGVDISQNNRMTVIEGVDLAQNTIIQNAYNTANVGNTFVKTGGTIGGSVIFTGDINVSGNIYLSGNSTLIASNTLSVNDSIIYLAANNNSNTLDLGIVGHFVGGSANKYQHTGVVRNHNNGTWTFFSNVSTEPSTVVNWAEANLVYDSIQTGGIISPTATINNIELGNYTQLAYNQANAISSYANSSITIMSGVNATQNSWISANQIYSQAAYAQANATNQYATSAYAQANATNNYATSAYGQANAANSLAGSSYIQANAANSLAQSGYNQANAANSLSSSAYAQANAANNLASSAYTQANATNNYATSAYNQANATNTYATSAYGQANAANSLAQSGYNQANASNSLAQSGYNQANSANSLASSSYAQANAANNYATSAYAQANATNTYATSAYGQANAANQYANVAFLTANNAVANLGPIITTNSAATVYVSNPTASTSNTTGALVVKGGLGVGGDINASNGTFTTITGQTEVLKGTGENLLTQSTNLANTGSFLPSNATITGGQSDPFGGTNAALFLPSAQYGWIREEPYILVVGVTYTVSLWCYVASGTRLFNVVDNASNILGSFTATTTWTRYSVTFTAVAAQKLVIIQDRNATGFVNTYVYGPQLEIGSTLNAYVPTTTTAVYGTPTISFSGVAGLSLASNGSLYVSPAGTSSTNVTSNLTVMSAATSTSNTTGALVVGGGLGVAGPIYSTGGSLTINNGLATTGNSGTIFLGDGSFTKTSGSLFTFSGGVSTTTLYGTTQVQAGAGTTTNPSYGLVGTSGIGMYFPTTGSIGFVANTANAVFITTPTSSVNYLQLSGNTTGGAPVIAAQGSDTNVGLNLTTQGTGVVNLQAGGATGLQVYNAGGGGQGAYWKFATNFSGTSPLMISSGSSGQISTGGTGGLSFYTNTVSQQQFAINHTASAVNYLTATGAVTTGYATLGVAGADGSPNMRIQGSSGGNLDITRSYNSTNASAISVGPAGGNTSDGSGGAFWRGFHIYGPNWTSGGSYQFPRSSQYFEFDTLTNPTYKNYYYNLGNSSVGNVINMIISNSAAGTIDFKGAQTNSNDLSFRIIPANAFSGTIHSNYLQVTGGLTANSPIMSSQGTDPNVSMTFLSKGTSAFNIQSANGINLGTGNTGITQINITSQGAGYTSFPTIAITSPTSNNGVQAAASVTALYASAATVASGGTGYVNGDILTVVGGTTSGAVQFQVTANSGGVITAVTRYNNGQYTVLPTNPVTVTGGTGSSATLNVAYYSPTVSITNPGSGYVEPPTVTFVGGGYSSQITGYAYVGGLVNNVKFLGSDLYVNSINGPVFRISDNSLGPITGYIQAAAAQNNGGATLQAGGSNASTPLYVGAGTNGSVNFFVGSSSYVNLKIPYTASVVNWVQVSGATTGAGPVISAQGSDSNIGLVLSAKGGGGNVIKGAGTYFQDLATSTNQFSVIGTSSAVNRISVTGNTTGNAPTISVVGSDTNVSMNIASQGTGNVNINAANTVTSGNLYVNGTLNVTGNIVFQNTTVNNVTINNTEVANTILVNQSYNQQTINVSSALQIGSNVTANGSVLAQNIYIQGGTNYVYNSANLQTSSWSTHSGDVSGNTTVTANTTIPAPDGSLTAWQLNNNGNQTTPIYGIFQQSGAPITSNGPYTISVWMRAGSLTSGQFFMSGGSDDSVSTGGVVTLTNQWQRFVFTGYNYVSGGARIQFSTNAQAGSILIWGPQIELGGPFTAKGVASPYIPTYSAVAVVSSNNSVYVPTGNVSASNIVTPNKINWVNSNNVSQMYQFYNGATQSYDLVFG